MAEQESYFAKKLREWQETEKLKRKKSCEEIGKKCRDCETICESRTECYSGWNNEGVKS